MKMRLFELKNIWMMHCYQIITKFRLFTEKEQVH